MQKYFQQSQEASVSFSVEALPTSNQAYFKLVIDQVLRMTSSLEIISQSIIGLKALEKQDEEVESGDIYNFFRQIFQVLLKYLYQILKNCLSGIECEEQVYQNILKSIQILVNLSASMRLASSTHQLIKLICAESSLAGFSASLIQANKTVLVIAHCMGALLDKTSWYYVMSFLRKSTQSYGRNRVAKDNSQEEASKSNDIVILLDTQEFLFRNSAQYPREQLLAVLDALNQITVEQLENYQVNGGAVDIFPLRKFYEIAKNNVPRIEFFWENLLSTFLCCIGSSKQSRLRTQSLELFGQLVLEAFSLIEKTYAARTSQLHLPQEQQKPEEEAPYQSEKWSRLNYQHTLFKPFIDIVKVNEQETKQLVLSFILRLLQNSGHLISESGWNCILDIVQQASVDSEAQSQLIGIQCIDLLISQYLGNLKHSKIESLLQLIENFKNFSGKLDFLKRLEKN